jgi:hypothetical protein
VSNYLLIFVAVLSKDEFIAVVAGSNRTAAWLANADRRACSVDTLTENSQTSHQNLSRNSIGSRIHHQKLHSRILLVVIRQRLDYASLRHHRYGFRSEGVRIKDYLRISKINPRVD